MHSPNAGMIVNSYIVGRTKYTKYEVRLARCDCICVHGSGRLTKPSSSSRCVHHQRFPAISAPYMSINMGQEKILAFATGAFPVRNASVGGASPSFCGRSLTTSPTRRAYSARASPPRMIYGMNEDKYKIGFTSYAERLNGRAAMIGFVCALAFELVYPESHGLVPYVQGLLANFL
jgi:hypothetical protein